jgi:hypothetical protein
MRQKKQREVGPTWKSRFWRGAFLALLWLFLGYGEEVSLVVLLLHGLHA